MNLHTSAAIRVAKTAHKDQVRKYTGEPYIVHPFAVAGLVASVTDEEEMIIAAFLHDTVEDTHITLAFLESLFGTGVSQLVDHLTDISRPEHGNRAARKTIDLEHTAGASARAKTIKLADLIDNTSTIVAFDPDFAKVYMAEKRRLLEVLSEGSPILFKIASNLVNNYFEV